MKPAFSKAYGTMVRRAWSLRCPRCGQEPLFANWLRMNTDCAHCHLHYEREPGYFLGSIYFNYGLTAALVTISYFALYFSGITSDGVTLVAVTALAILFPLWFFRYARGLWLGFDHFWDPMAGDPSAEREDR
jgi:uncharacterized protein (DUF983 family)